LKNLSHIKIANLMFTTLLKALVCTTIFKSFSLLSFLSPIKIEGLI